jgi:hypothetical protein
VGADQVTIFTGESPQLDTETVDVSADALQFDRLARELFIRLGAFPGEG